MKWKAYSQFYPEIQRTYNSQNNFEKGKQSWKTSLSDFKTLQKVIVFKAVVLAQKETYTSKEQN